MRLALTLFAVAINFAGPQSAVAPVQSPARPIVEFEKTRFVAGERVFFWVGVEVSGQKTPEGPRADTDDREIDGEREQVPVGSLISALTNSAHAELAR